ncbi:MAG: GntR family transcriptional regulator [Firmicutes bacterium]|nr:GntR family transcriptional regulator [Bacillota bacterium]
MEEKITVGSLVEQIYKILHDDIVSLRLAPGQKLSVDSLVRRFGVSRTPVRDALNILVTDGLVTLSPRVGYFVVSLTPLDVEEISDIRKMIELYALPRAVRQITPAEIGRMEQETRRIQQLPESERRQTFERVDRSFHLDLIRLAGNKRLVEMFTEISAFIDLMRHLDVRINDALNEHLAILQAMREGNEAAAAKQLETHLENVKHAVLTRFAAEAKAGPRH